MQISQPPDKFQFIIPDISALDNSEDDDSSAFDDDDLLEEHDDGGPLKEPEADIPIFGIVQTYLLELKECLSREIDMHKITSP